MVPELRYGDEPESQLRPDAKRSRWSNWYPHRCTVGIIRSYLVELTGTAFSSDLKAMAKVTTAVLILRKGKSTLWTSDLDNQLISWTNEYITWLETAKIAVEESIAPK